MPATDKTLPEARSTVGKAIDWLVKRRLEFVAPLIVMLPPGAVMDPKTATVSPVKDTLPFAPGDSELPDPTTKSPRLIRLPLKVSLTPGASNTRLTGARSPSGKTIGIKLTGPLSPLKSQLCTTGAITVSA